MGWYASLGLSAVVVVALGMAGIGQAASTNDSTIVYEAHPPHVFGVAAGSKSGLPDTARCIDTFGLACYTPAQIRNAYDIPSDDTGAGETIVIVDAFGSPTIRTDLSVFDQTFGLPPATLNILYPDGAPNFTGTPTQLGWAEETSLDVEWAHAIAPGATIDLVVAPSPDGNVLNDVENYAVENHLGNVMSMSFGAPEAAIAGQGNNLQLQQAEAIYTQAAAQGMSIFASAGDQGATNGYSEPNANFPASSPYVTSVGGTDLFLRPNGTYASETVWNDSDPATCPYGCSYGVFGATGGAPSEVFATPSYQAGVTGFATRTTSDVAYNASVYTAIWVYLSVPGLQAGYYFFGGTSEGAPQWAAIAALADAAAHTALGPLNPRLYAIAQNPSLYSADFHNVTVGNNALNGPGYDAGPGYNLPTGLGTPDVGHLIQTLVASAGS